MKASPTWLVETGADFKAGDGLSGIAHLTHYTAEYKEWGEGPPLVLIPGLAGGYELLGPLARALSPYFRVISYQLRGEDDCFALRRPFLLKDLVSDLAEFLDWHHLENPPIVGISFGGTVALEFAVRFPHRLESLMLQGVGSKFERNLFQHVAGLVLSRYPLPADSPFVNQFFNLLFGYPQKRDSLFHFVTQQCWQTDQSVMAHRIRLVESFDMSNKLQRIRVPSLVLSGDRDVLVSKRGSDELTAGIPDCRRVTLNGCGHLAFATKPERMSREIRRFINDS